MCSSNLQGDLKLASSGVFTSRASQHLRTNWPLRAAHNATCMYCANAIPTKVVKPALKAAEPSISSPSNASDINLCFNTLRLRWQNVHRLAARWISTWVVPPNSSSSRPSAAICCLAFLGSAPGRSHLVRATTMGHPLAWASCRASLVWGFTPSSAATTRTITSVTAAPLHQ